MRNLAGRTNCLQGAARHRRPQVLFIVLAGVLQDVEVLPLIKDESSVWTFGANAMNIDYEARWKDYLAGDDFKAKGDSTSRCTDALPAAAAFVPHPVDTDGQLQ
jgi:hypothetical protein